VTAQRLGAAIGIAVIGTALFGSGSGGAGSGGAGGTGGVGGSGGAASTVVPSLVHHAGIATLVNLCFIAAALACSFGLPRRLAGDNGTAGSDTGGNGARQGAAASVRDH
jgi:hypothetical protein